MDDFRLYGINSGEEYLKRANIVRQISLNETEEAGIEDVPFVWRDGLGEFPPEPGQVLPFLNTVPPLPDTIYAWLDDMPWNDDLYWVES